jgi:hypothetical protein
VSKRHLSVYLNDHLAGFAARLERVDALRTRPGFDQVAERLRIDIDEDRQELLALIRRQGAAPSQVRQAAVSITEKLMQVKTRLDDPIAGALQTLELTEALALGVDGKRALWAALPSSADRVPSLQGVDYPSAARCRKRSGFARRPRPLMNTPRRECIKGMYSGANK